jgi:hypothetical protein
MLEKVCCNALRRPWHRAIVKWGKGLQLGVNGGCHRGNEGLRYGLIAAVGLHKVSFVSWFNYDTGFNNFIQADAARQV